MNANAPTNNNKTMKKTLLFAPLALLLLVACEKTPTYTISGNCGTSNDTLYLFGLDSRHDKVEKIISDAEGNFTHAIATTRNIPLMLALPDGNTIPLYAEPSIEAQLTADTLKSDGWAVKGGKEQALYDSIACILDKFDSNSERITHIDNFIKKYPFSEINIEIMRRFLVDVPNPNNGFIKKRINNLGGTLQDHEYFVELKQELENKSNNMHKMLPSFNYTTASGKNISPKEYRDKILIINFWAAWDTTSRIALKEQSKLYAQKDTSKITLLNISLDYDTAVWHKSLIEDSIAGDNVCDGKAWSNELVTKFSITSLPYTVAVSPFQRIDSYGIEQHLFSTTADSLVRKYFDKKEKKKR